ncbi:MAG TPA: hypothetical protein VLW49_09585, partial [Gaiellaceae bacterium]|nr:hypothetical protein [Gaiellaceae bacterium]
RLVKTDAEAEPEDLANARVWAAYCIRLNVGGARARFLELRPAARHADHEDFADLAESLEPFEIREIASAMGDHAPAHAIRAALAS